MVRGYKCHIAGLESFEHIMCVDLTLNSLNVYFEEHTNVRGLGSKVSLL